MLGSQWGDEGKGKLVDILAREYDVVARCQGGANAGHTIYDDDGKKYALHLVPSGILNKNATCVVGNGVVVHLPGMFDEIDALLKAGVDARGRMIVSDRAHLLFDLHKEIDGLREAELSGNKIGTTKRGIGPAYASKATRNGIRLGDIRNEEKFATALRALAADAAARFDGFEYDVEAEIGRYKDIAARIEPFIADTLEYVNDAYDNGKKILVEGANATMLDLDFGTYPFVTSSNPALGGVCNGLGLAPRKFETVIGVAKAYTTRVGAGPYPTELFGDLADDLREKVFGLLPALELLDDESWLEGGDCLIGRTSAITFQVVGHAKTCLVLIGGFVLFPAKLADTTQLYNNIDNTQWLRDWDFPTYTWFMPYNKRLRLNLTRIANSNPL